MTPPPPSGTGLALASVRALPAALLIGTMVGLVSALGDGVRIMVVNGLANAISPWVLGAFAAGAVAGSPGLGAVSGVAALIAALALYYGGFLLEGHTFLVPLVAAWSVAALGTGVLLGAAGGAWRSRQDGWKTLAVGLLAGSLVAEAAHRLILIETWTGVGWGRTYTHVAAANLVIAGVLLLVLAPGRRLAATAVMLVVGGVALLALFALDLF
jgi:hypothetical protein